jgi:hypothetical protein
VTDWLHLKTQIVATIGLDRDALHVYASVLIQFAVAIALRRSIGNWLPWLAVLMAACGNEVLDVGVEVWPDPAMQAAQAVHDIVNSMILPTLLVAAVRLGPPRLFGKRDL